MNSWAFAARAAAASSSRGRVGLAEAEILLDGSVKEDGVLVDDRDPSVHVVGGELAEVASPDADRPRVRVVEAKDEADDRRLACTARPHEPDPFPGLDPEIEAAVSRAARPGISKVDRLELHRRRKLLSTGGVPGVGVLHDRPPREEA